jgi:hypothetical protein
MNRLATMEALVRVVETGSFSAAARQLHLGQPAVSKMIAQLEERLGVQLLLRSTQGLTPTGAGQSCNPVDDVAKEITKQVYDLIVHGPARPTASLADTLYQRYARNVEQLRSEPRQPTDLTSDFDSTYGATLLNLQGQLNVNLGGHAN